MLTYWYFHAQYVEIHRTTSYPTPHIIVTHHYYYSLVLPKYQIQRTEIRPIASTTFALLQFTPEKHDGRSTALLYLSATLTCEEHADPRMVLTILLADRRDL
jgi:hypothetical protein